MRWRQKAGLFIPSMYLWQVAYGELPALIGAEKAKASSGHGGDPLTSVGLHFYPDLIRKVQFRRHNLASDPCPAGKFDLILCRNLLFYFAPERRHRLFDRLAGVLANEGLLVLGAGETVIGQARGLVPSERFRGFYCRAAEDAGRT